MYDLSLTKIRQPRNPLKVELIPVADLILNILKDIIRDLILGYSNEIVLPLEIPSLAYPYRVAFLTRHFGYVLEVFHSHFFVWWILEARLVGIDEGF